MAKSNNLPNWITATRGGVDIFKARRTANIFFFMVAAAKVCLLPFLPIFLRQLGMTALQTGLLVGGHALIALVAAILWRSCAKRFHKHRGVMVLSVFVMITTYISLTVVPPVDERATLMFCHGKNGNVVGDHPNQTGQQGSDNLSTIAPFIVTTISKPSVNNKGTLNTSTVAVHTSTVAHVQATSKPNNTVAQKPRTTGTSAHKSLTGITPKKSVTATTPKKSVTGTTPKKSVTGTTPHVQKIPTPHGPTTTKNKTLDAALLRKWLSSSVDSKGKTTPHAKTEAEISNNSTKTVNKSNETTSLPAEDNESGNNEVLDNLRHVLDYDFQTRKRVKRKIPETLTKITGNIKNELNTLSEKVYAMKYHTFFIIMAILFVGQLLTPPLEDVADQAWHEYLDNVDDLEKYGTQRLWSSIASALFAVAIVLVVEHTDCLLSFQIHHFMIHFYSFAVLMFFVIFIIMFYPVQMEVRPKKNSKTGGLCRTLFTDCRCGLYIFTILIAGFVYAPASSFLFWLIQDKHGNELQMGAAICVSAIAEFFMLLFGGKFVKRFGHSVVIVFGLIMLSARLLYYSFLWTPWAVVPIEALHGFSNTGLWMAVVSYPEFSSNPRMERFATAVFHTLFHGIGYAAGSIVSGYVYDIYSISLVYQVGAGITILWTVLFAMFNRCLPARPRVRYSKLLQDNEYTSDSEDDWLEMAMKDH